MQPSLVRVRKHLAQINSSTQRALPFWVSAAATAAVSVVYANVFGWSEQLALEWAAQSPALAFVITPLALVLSAGIAQYFAPLASGSGIPQILAAVEASRDSSWAVNKILSVRTIILKFFGSCVCVAGGGITGREGPMLQISAGIFNLCTRWWPVPGARPNLQSMILAGGAAGLASAFNTPLGGILFAIEELAKVHISRIGTTVFHAVIIAGLLAQAVLGNYLYFGRVQLVPSSFLDFFPSIAASAVIGMLGALFGKETVRVLSLRANLSPRMRMGFTFLCGLAVGALIFFKGTGAVGSGRAVIVDLLTHPESPASVWLGLARGLGNFVTYAGGVIGGVFAPALSTGAALGSWLGSLIPGASHELWTLMGMTAFLTGVTRTPFTSCILVLEMTDTHNVIIHLMLAAVTANSTARLIDPVSFYEHMSVKILKGLGANSEPK